VGEPIVSIAAAAGEIAFFGQIPWTTVITAVAVSILLCALESTLGLGTDAADYFECVSQ
jgi:hypothetical protein